MATDNATPLDDTGRKALKVGDVVTVMNGGETYECQVAQPPRQLVTSNGTPTGRWIIGLTGSEESGISGTRPIHRAIGLVSTPASRGPATDIEPGEAEQTESIYAQAKDAAKNTHARVELTDGFAAVNRPKTDGERVDPRDAGIQWRCFHCGDTFTQSQHAHAREHFGRDEGETPVCLMRVPGEHGLIAALRKAQDELASWRAESDPLTRAIECQAADYEQRLIREEEKGYARGLKDYTKVEGERDALRTALAKLVAAAAKVLRGGSAKDYQDGQDMLCTAADEAKALAEGAK